MIVAGRVENLFINSVNPQLETMETAGHLLENVAVLIDNIEKIGTKFADIDFKEWKEAINKTEDWILDIIN